MCDSMTAERGRWADRAIALGFGGVFLLWMAGMLWDPARIAAGPVGFGLGLVIVGLCALAARWLLRVRDERRLTLAFGAAYLLLLGLHAGFVLYTARPVGWDVSILCNAANSSLSLYDSWTEYFVRCANNIPMTLLFQGWIRLLNRIGLSWLWYWCKLSLLNLLFIHAAVLLCGGVTARLTGKRRTAFGAMLLALCLFGLRPEVVVPYSDTMVQPCILAAFLCWLLARKQTRLSRRLLWYGLFGLAAGLGYQIKPPSAILLIALVCLWIVRARWRELRWFSLLAAAVFCAAFWVCSVPGRIALSRLQTLNPETDPLSPYHYLCIGLTGSGGFSQDMVEFSRSMNGWSAQEKRDAYLDCIREEYADTGVWGLLRHERDKFFAMGTDGSFYFGREGSEDLSEKKPDGTLGGLLQNYVYRDTAFYQSGVAPFQQGVWLAFCGLMVWVAWRQLRLCRPETSVLMLAFCGLVLFLLLFENRSRYLLSYLPVLTCLAAGALTAPPSSAPDRPIIVSTKPV